NEKATVKHILRQLTEERGLDPPAALADMRFSFIKDLVSATVVEPRESKERARSRRIDKVLTGRFTAIPAFLVGMSLIFYLTFDGIGFWAQEWLASLIDNLTTGVDRLMNEGGVDEVIRSLVVDGVFGGVGSVLSFMPIIITLFFFLSLLEDSGYMARIAFVMDKLLRKIGLSGRSVVPLLVGFGCSVPGIMASRTLPSERDRRMTVLLTPFMSCTAKLPIYAFISAAFFPHCAARVMISLHLLGIVMAVVVALIFKKTMFRGEAVPFVMELPNYRMPSFKNVVRRLWDKASDFLRRAFTVIFMAGIVIWFLQTFDFRLSVVDNSHDSMLAWLAGLLSPVFEPMGFGDWRVTTSLLSGFMAKESVVSTAVVVFGSTSQMLATMGSVSAYALLVFCLLYTPCVAAIASVGRELGWRYAVGVIVGQCVLAWIVSFAIYNIMSMLPVAF
ncbi:MAG: ferrous iron transport protein B, partial [Bacteroidaceae bacterium]